MCGHDIRGLVVAFFRVLLCVGALVVCCSVAGANEKERCKAVGGYCICMGGLLPAVVVTVVSGRIGTALAILMMGGSVPFFM